ncbi:OLC1v1016755C1 [Oldenlandia corymbosa var. corymbosa]|uniref:OLC1v1016755C1 n=1 Tax=Oldenlandia corymbosa var. corymbosa TaxID=529605 RepID=A0AAV1E7X0_OLDCO|nr:OLC1v1016755C1 [Oldenlandia corymbosa var. corymbosa]
MSTWMADWNKQMAYKNQQLKRRNYEIELKDREIEAKDHQIYQLRKELYQACLGSRAFSTNEATSSGAAMEVACDCIESHEGRKATSGDEQERTENITESVAKISWSEHQLSAKRWEGSRYLTYTPYWGSRSVKAIARERDDLLERVEQVVEIRHHQLERMQEMELRARHAEDRERDARAKAEEQIVRKNQELDQLRAELQLAHAEIQSAHVEFQHYRESVLACADTLLQASRRHVEAIEGPEAMVE